MGLIEKVLVCLPERGRSAFNNFLSSQDKSRITELRFRADAPASITYAGKNICSFAGNEIIFSEAEMRDIVAKLCEESVHTYGKTMTEGYITLSDGARIGICGRVRSDKNNIIGLRDVTSLCVRVPHIIYGVSDEIMPLLYSQGRAQSALIYSAPGVGKTTLIRDIAKKLSSGARRLRVAVVDSRGEIYIKEMFAHSLCDFLDGYPKGIGMEIATRTLSPQVIICDEIGGTEDAESILRNQNGGVPLIATAHASDLASLMQCPNIKKLHDARVFKYYIGISRSAESEKFIFDIARREE